MELMHDVEDAEKLLAQENALTQLKNIQDKDNWTELLVRQEEMKTLPFGEIWDEYCRSCGVPVDGEWFGEIQKYEAEVLSTRG